MTSQSQVQIPVALPKRRSNLVSSAVLHVVSLAWYALADVRGRAARSLNARVRLAAELGWARQEIALLREKIRIKDARMARIPPHRRPPTHTPNAWPSWT